MVVVTMDMINEMIREDGYTSIQDIINQHREAQKINEDHRKLNGELRQELDDAWDCINKMRATYIELDAAYNMFLNTETQLRFNITHREENT